MGNKTSVDKTPSPIDNIITYPITNLPNVNLSEDKDNFYQHISLWSFSEASQQLPKTADVNQTEMQKQIISNAIDLTDIQKSHFLLSGSEVYIILLIFKKEKEHIIEQSPFPTGLWGIIESSSNMTPRGLLYAFPANNDSQNLESFLLSKRDFTDSEFKYMLFIWNGKSSSALLRSYTLMKAFDLDKALSSPKLVPFIYYGYHIGQDVINKSDSIILNDIINNTIENSEDSRPSSEKISNYHETVYLLKWLYPIQDGNNSNSSSNNNNKKNEKRVKKEKICFKGFNNNFLKTTNKKSFYNNFKPIELNHSDRDKNIITSSKPHIPNIQLNSILNQTSSLSGCSNNNKANTIMPPKLNLSLYLKNNNNNNNISNSNSNSNNSNPNSNSNNPSKNNSNTNRNVNEDIEDDDLSINDDDVDNIALCDIHNNQNMNRSNMHPPQLNVSQLKIPKLMVSMQHNLLNDKLISQRSKKKAEEEDSLNEIPESTIIQTSDKILSQIENEESYINSLNEDYNLKDADRKKIISDYYSKHLSEIIPNFLYLSSYNAAKNKELLEKNGITHIINCAADFCENVYEDDPKYNYIAFYLKDHVMENIECIFYECIHYIEKVRETKGRVLVHCIQGISRSVSVIISYLIFKNKYTYDKAFNYVQSRRTIASPNFGFAIQLQNFYLRLFESPENYRYNPKIYAVSAFQQEQLSKIVCRIMNEKFFENKENGQTRMFDTRGVFLIVAPCVVYIWHGRKISPAMKDIYVETARSYVSVLQQYENSPKKVVDVYEGEESEEFVKCVLNTKDKVDKYKKTLGSEFVEWNNWYKEAPVKKEEEKKMMMSSSYQSSQVDDVKKAFFLFPNLNAEYVLDFDDLNDGVFLLGCVAIGRKRVVYKWKGNSVEISEEEINEYMNKVIKTFFDKVDKEMNCGNNKNEIEIIEEVPMEESDEFLSLL